MFSRGVALGAASVWLVALGLTARSTANADPSPSPGPISTISPTATSSATLSPAPSSTPRAPGLHVDSAASITFVNQGTSGGGQVGPEAPGFLAGSPLSPNTPYDLFSSAPQVPGIAGIGALVSTATYRSRTLDIGLTAGLGYVRGSTTNATYWGENLLPTLNPHLGSQALPYAIAFPTHAGGDDGTALRLSLLGASIATADGNLRVRGGWFDLAQTDRFVFAPPALTSVNPQIAYAPAESLSSGLAGAPWWQPAATALPLHGIDAVVRHGDATIELTSAALPSLPGQGARMTMGSLVFDRGEGTRFSAQLLHVATSGAPFGTTIPTGLDPRFTPTPQGILPTSTLSGQRQTIAGVRGAFHLLPAEGVDAVVEIGRAWYDAAPVARPGTEAPGGFYHVGLAWMHNRATAALDLYRMEPRYATIILPYGVPENQWSAAFAWPGQWLKSNYQLIDNSVLGVNRQGYRLRYAVDEGPLEARLEFTNLQQIEPETTSMSTQSGYVDGYYLPQVPDAATFGRQKRYGFWAAWHPRFGDVTLDVVDDTLYRPFAPAHPEDRVSYEVPQAVVTYSRAIAANATFAAGLGRYAIKGAFAEPLDFAERLAFAGVQFRSSSRASTLITFRRTAFAGMSTFPASPASPNFTGSALVAEERLRF